MKNYVGIDLGTTNSVICTFSGGETRIWKSPEQNDVTPSAIYLDPRGNKYVGRRAYDSAPHSPGNVAKLFKRSMGTGDPIKFPALGVSMTPEECSAEILRTLFGYLPEEVRNDPATGTVITVPAAFDQMQKNSTMEAAELSGIGGVALMQEPVAAVMSAMRTREFDGTFLVYDLGGGTFDAALAESISGRVYLRSHGGVSFCGGADFDRLIFDNMVEPWLCENFAFSDPVSTSPGFDSIRDVALWAVERAKVELSSREEAAIVLSEMETRARDQSGRDIYIEIPLIRKTLDDVIERTVKETVAVTQEMLSNAGVSSHDVERIVFVGGPTNYRPLRDRVSFELGIPANTEVNPMTAVAEGAALFAEAYDWSSRGQKPSTRQVSLLGQHVKFKYTVRTPEARAKIVVQVAASVAEGGEFQVDSLDTGWSSGRLPLSNGKTLEVPLSASGENDFKVFVFDAGGSPVALNEDKISVSRTVATIGAIPASHSIGIAVLENVMGNEFCGRPRMEWLVQAGDRLPKRGKHLFRAGESLKSGSAGSLNFSLFQGDSDEPEDNRFVGVLKILGTDFGDGEIVTGAELQCEFEMRDSGTIGLNVSVPSISAAFRSDRNFYSPQEAKINYSAEAERLAEMARGMLGRLNQIAREVKDPRLDEARGRLESATNLDPDDPDDYRRREAGEIIESVRKILGKIKRENRPQVWQMRLDATVKRFEKRVQKHARPEEERAFRNLAATARRALERGDEDFERHLHELRGKNSTILWRQDWFVVEQFKHRISSPHWYVDEKKFDELVETGKTYMQNDDIKSLRRIIWELWRLQINLGADDDAPDIVNIVRG